MKKIFLFVAMVLSSTILCASNRESVANTNAETEFTANSDDLKKWTIRADTWVIAENRWYEYPQLIHIHWTKESGLYLWKIGGSTSPVRTSDKRGYDYMVDEADILGRTPEWRFYFNRSDLR